MKSFAKLVLAAGLLFPVSGVVADVLLLDGIAEEPSNSAEGIPRPKRRLSMDEVRQAFGDPIEAFPWVGDPPITRWRYKDYTVYFEYDRVINSVINR